MTEDDTKADPSQPPPYLRQPEIPERERGLAPGQPLVRPQYRCPYRPPAQLPTRGCA